MKSWKTSLSGVAAILTGAGTLIVSVTGKNPEGILVGLSSLGSGLGLIFARDNDKSSEDVGTKYKPRR